MDRFRISKQNRTMREIAFHLSLKILCVMLFFSSAIALADEKCCQLGSGLRFFGLLDTYAGTFLSSKQTSIHRGFTQPTKNNSPAINMASFGVETSGDWSFRVIGQAGTSVDENYSSEKHPTFRYIQEINVARKINDQWSLLAGIYPGNIGLETFLTPDNLTYTRSFHAEFSPYYQRGLRLRYQPAEEWKFELHAISGYQEISETRLLPALGSLAQYGLDGEFQISHSSYLGHRDGGTRVLNDVVLKIPLNSIFLVQLVGDVGVEDSEVVSGTWGGGTAILEAKLFEDLSAVFRAEKFVDSNRVVTSFSDRPLDMNGFSFGLNYKPEKNIYLRGEARSILASNRIFSEDSSSSSNSTFLVGSLAINF